MDGGAFVGGFGGEKGDQLGTGAKTGLSSCWCQHQLAPIRCLTKCVCIVHTPSRIITMLSPSASL